MSRVNSAGTIIEGIRMDFMFNIFMFVVYSKSKIHGVYSSIHLAKIKKDQLLQKAGVNSLGIPKRFYYISQELILDNTE
jgi:hypothetical protein